MKNPRVTPKDRNLIKGALRRAFSRSALRNEVLAKSIVEHFDDLRPRVKTWCRCAQCDELEARSYMVVDHISPLVPVYTTFAEMDLEDAIDRLWCHPSNLQVLCQDCHDKKTLAEKQERKRYKKENKK